MLKWKFFQFNRTTPTLTKLRWKSNLFLPILRGLERTTFSWGVFVQVPSRYRCVWPDLWSVPYVMIWETSNDGHRLIYIEYNSTTITKMFYYYTTSFYQYLVSLNVQDKCSKGWIGSRYSINCNLFVCKIVLGDMKKEVRDSDREVHDDT